MSSQQEFSTIASAPIFVVSSDVQIAGGGSLGKIAFQELGGINSEINIEQYISAAPGGFINHSKQFGLVKPPTVTLKRGLDKNLTLWQWHQMAVAGNPAARADQLTLEVFGGGLGSIGTSKPLVTYMLMSAWCAKINISSAKAGEGFLTEDVVIACDAILLDTGG
ncbi:MAG TPA: phage tail protein [Actinocrinis sp.]|uniref:phage tail protein n=1 Tax=Actinocrinis sp. TaxID=1920516 RepID=UPI002DDD5581|nr:phage tail protein [Actinocrinis sp.]HEV2344681.1 phage tail protein [Actinocrinis sp.]